VSKKILLTLSVALSLAGALTTQAGPPKKNPPPILISSLPFTITAPGTYVLTGNLTSSDSTNAAAIRIPTNIPGPVTVDLNGFTLTGGGVPALELASVTLPELTYPIPSRLPFKTEGLLILTTESGRHVVKVLAYRKLQFIS
jgi:hypothetical protein